MYEFCKVLDSKWSQGKHFAEVIRKHNFFQFYIIDD